MTTKLSNLLPTHLPRNLPETLPRDLPAPSTTDSEQTLSLYRDPEASHNNIALAMQRLSVAFPRMGSLFFNLLAERVLSNHFTAARLEDAVNQIIDNFQYKELNISDLLRFDRRVKLYTYNEVSHLVTKGEVQFSDFELREINGTTYRVKKTDLIQTK